MLKFFRTIRQNTIMDLPSRQAGNKTSKYIKYALGEIVLVVIGIMIALQINNWNEDRSERKVEKEYISSLIEDLTTDTDRYTFLIDHFALKEARIDLILGSYLTLSEGYDHELYSSLQEVISYPDFVYTDKTMKQLMNAGGMRLIRDKEVSNAIIEYDSAVRRLTESLMPDLNFYYRHSNEMWFEVMDIAAWEADTALLSISQMENGNKNYLLRSDKEALGKWNNVIRNFQSDLILIREVKEELNAKASRLIELLNRKYDLDTNA